MSMIAAIAVGSALGGVCRYLLGLFIQRWTGAVFPFGTLIINISGSLLLGFLLRSTFFAIDAKPVARALLTIGFCGGYTTFSAFSYETAAMLEEGLYSRVALYVTMSLVLSLIATFVGFQLARGAFPFASGLKSSS